MRFLKSSALNNLSDHFFNCRYVTVWVIPPPPALPSPPPFSAVVCKKPTIPLPSKCFTSRLNVPNSGYCLFL